MARTARQLLAQRVRTLRQTRGWSQEDLAEASGLHRTYVGGIERAERNCTLEVLASLACALDVSLAELLEPTHLDPPDQVREPAQSYAAARPGRYCASPDAVPAFCVRRGPGTRSRPLGARWPASAAPAGPVAS